LSLLPKFPPTGAWVTAGTLAVEIAAIAPPVHKVLMERAENGWALKIRAGDGIHYALLDEAGDVISRAVEIEEPCRG
jgi:hypothetical protein